MHHAPSARRARTVTLLCVLACLVTAELGMLGVRFGMPDYGNGLLAAACLLVASMLAGVTHRAGRRPLAQRHFVVAGDRFRARALTGLGMLSVAIVTAGVLSTPFSTAGGDVVFAGSGGIAALLLMCTFLPPVAEAG